MNKFDQFFFNKYTTDWAEVIEIAHKHITVIIDKIVLNYFLWVILPTFFYYISDLLKSFIPFFVLEIFILIVFIINIYNVFDWYNDVWIITSEWVTELNWKLFSSDSVSVKYNSIEGLELIQGWFIDTILWKWKIVINKIWWDENSFALENATNAFKVLEKIDLIQRNFEKPSEVPSDDGTNFEVVVKALSWVVEEYLWKAWPEKDTSKETQELIDRIKEIDWTIDLSN